MNHSRSLKTLNKFIELAKTQKKGVILDIGCGQDFYHANEMKTAGLTVKTNDFFEGCDYKGKFTENNFKEEKFDGIWCSHVLEHQENVGRFLKAILFALKDDGLLALTVPPAHIGVVGGHLTLWNLGLLYYNLIVAGFDCSKAIHCQYESNISVILNKKHILNMPKLVYDTGDIEALAPYFPFQVCQGFHGVQIPNTF